MLRTETVERLTIELIRQLLSFPELKDFNLVGGTALALQIGHRKSVDIDIFTNIPFDSKKLRQFLSDRFGDDYKDIQVFENTVMGFIKNIKSDFICHKYALISEIKIIENIRMAGLEDLAAMKVNAVYGSGQRVKDFIDIYYLLEYFPINEMINIYSKKYPSANPAFALKSISYFQDVDLNGWPEMTDKKLTWKKITKTLTQEVKKFMLSRAKGKSIT